MFEPTTTLKIALFIAVDSFQSGDENDFELGISAAASLANYIIQQRSQVGLFANALSPIFNESIQLAPAGGNARMVGILEALAAIDGRNYVIPDDVKHLVVPVLAHRIIVKSETGIRGHSAETVINEILDKLPAPIRRDDINQILTSRGKKRARNRWPVYLPWRDSPSFPRVSGYLPPQG